MNTLKLGTRLGLGLLVMAASAPAALAAPDEHLYLRTEQDLYWVYHGHWRHRRWGGWGWISPRVSVHHYLTEGRDPISTEQFVDLIRDSQADPGFTRRVAERDADRDRWGTAALSSVSLLGMGLVLGAIYPPAPSGTSSWQSTMALGVSLTGLTASVITGAVWADKSSRPRFTLDEARRAIDAYNRELDRLRRTRADSEPT